jgi:hypothetical protein
LKTRFSETGDEAEFCIWLGKRARKRAAEAESRSRYYSQEYVEQQNETEFENKTQVQPLQQQIFYPPSHQQNQTRLPQQATQQQHYHNVLICGHRDEGTPFCGKCPPVPMPVAQEKCHACGAIIPSDHLRCSMCGGGKRMASTHAQPINFSSLQQNYAPSSQSSSSQDLKSSSSDNWHGFSQIMSHTEQGKRTTHIFRQQR